jgi:hypothetical protein
MLIGGSDGSGWRYEVVAREEGFLVRMRDLATGEVEANEARLFRTAAVAFAHAEAMAAIDRFASASIVDEPADDLLAEAELAENRFVNLSDLLGDRGRGFASEQEAACLRLPTYH